MVSRLGAAYITRLTQWMRDTFLDTAVGGPMSWVSGVELLIGFVIATGFLPPVYIAKRKRWERSPHLVATVSQRTRWFCQHLVGLVRAHGGALTSCKDGRPVLPRGEAPMPRAGFPRAPEDRHPGVHHLKAWQMWWFIQREVALTSCLRGLSCAEVIIPVQSSLKTSGAVLLTS